MFDLDYLNARKADVTSQVDKFKKEVTDRQIAIGHGEGIIFELGSMIQQIYQNSLNKTEEKSAKSTKEDSESNDFLQLDSSNVELEKNV